MRVRLWSSDDWPWSVPVARCFTLAPLEMVLVVQLLMRAVSVPLSDGNWTFSCLNPFQIYSNAGKLFLFRLVTPMLELILSHMTAFAAVFSQ